MHIDDLEKMGITVSQIEYILDHPFHVHITGNINIKAFMEAHGFHGPDITVPFVIEEKVTISGEGFDYQFVESKLTYYRFLVYTYLLGGTHGQVLHV